MLIPLEKESVNIVLIGSFNPRIMRPEWFAKNDLLSDLEEQAASIEVIHPDIAKFKTEWLAIEVSQTRFLAEAQRPPHVMIKDLVVRLFSETLPHTPIGRMGFNRNVHFPVDAESKEKIGNLLAPKGPWGEWGESLAGPTTGLNHGGMLSLTMIQRDLDDRVKGHVQATIGPSADVDPGITMAINDHFEIEDPANASESSEIIEILQANFDASMARSEKIIDQIMSLA